MSILCLTLCGLPVELLHPLAQLEGPANGGKGWPLADEGGGGPWLDEGNGGGRIGCEGEAVGCRTVVAGDLAVAGEADRRGWSCGCPGPPGEDDRRLLEGVGFIILSRVSFPCASRSLDIQHDPQHLHSDYLQYSPGQTPPPEQV